MGWLSHHRQTPFFIWLHFYDAHEPYDPPEPFNDHAKEPYDGEIAYTDSVVGGLLQVLQQHGLFQNTVIAVVADHGEAFGEHGERWHGMFLYDETIHVPLLLKLPGQRLAGKRVEDRVALADVAPSLLEAASVSVPSTMQGESLFPLMSKPKSGTGKDSAGGKKPLEREIYSESNYAHRVFGWSELHSLREGKYLYVQAPKKELYDQNSDPKALKNLATTANAVTNTLDSQLSDFRKKTSGADTGKPKRDPAQMESLRSLGYLGTDSGGLNSKEKVLIDPKDKIDFANKVHEYVFDLETDKYEQAVASLREIIRQYPSDAGIPISSLVGR